MPIASRAPKRGHNDEVNEGKGACFDLLGLSNKTINKVLSYLPVKDRMRARLNKRLSKIEAESKCYLKKVELKQISFSEHSTCVNIKNRWYPFDFLKRIARNTSIGRLEIDFYPDGLIHKFCNLTKEFRSISTIYVKLNLQFLKGETANLVKTDSFFVDLTKLCEILKLDYSSSITSTALHQVYTRMIDGSSNLHKVITPALEKETLEAFLNFLGISYIDGRVISTRNVEVYKDSTNDVGDYYVNIFDGFFHIRFNVFYNVFDGDFTVQLHKTIDALKKAKNRPIDDKHKRTRMKVYSE